MEPVLWRLTWRAKEVVAPRAGGAHRASAFGVRTKRWSSGRRARESRVGRHASRDCGVQVLGMVGFAACHVM